MKDSRSSTHVRIGVRESDGRCVSIDEVDRGLKCDCICAVCKQPLIARKGDIRAQHFAHAVQSDCKGMGETHLHLAAKQILKKRREILLPNYRGREYGQSWDEDKEYLTVSMLCSPRHRDLLEESRGIVTKGEIVEADDDVKEEERLEGFQPDIIIPKGDRELLVEIRVTHETEEEKRKKLSRRNLPSIEIDLSKTGRDVRMKDLEGIVVGDGPEPAPRQWLSHPKGEERALRESKARKEEFARRIVKDGVKLSCGIPGLVRYGKDRVRDCPIGRMSTSTCITCKYHVAHFCSGDEYLHAELTGRKDKDVVYCAYPHAPKRELSSRTF